MSFTTSIFGDFGGWFIIVLPTLYQKFGICQVLVISVGQLFPWTQAEPVLKLIEDLLDGAGAKREAWRCNL